MAQTSPLAPDAAGSKAASVAPSTPDQIRLLRDSVDSSAGRTGRAAQTFSDAAQSMQYNHIGSPAEVKLLTSDSAALNNLAQQPTGQTMPTVREKLGAALYGNAPKSNIAAAGADQIVVIQKLDNILHQLHAISSGGFAATVNELIEQQRQIKAQTAKLFQSTLGETRADLSTQQKAQLKQNEQQEQNFNQAVQKTMNDLKNAANNAQKESDPEREEMFENTRKQLEKADVSSMISQASDDIHRNHLNSAQNQQANVIKALQQAHDMLQSNANQMSDSELYQKMMAAEALAQEEQNLLNQTQQQNQRNQRNQDAMNALEMKQSQIGANIKKEGFKHASASAQKAQNQLGKGQGKAAESSERQTLAALQKEGNALKSMLNGKQPGKGTPPVPQDIYMAKAPKSHTGMDMRLQAGLTSGPKGGSQWKGVPLTEAQKKALNTVAAQQFPAKYRSALEAYYRSLADSNGSNGSDNGN